MKEELYRHYKGGIYRVLCYAKMEASEEEVVVYESLKGGIPWVRPLKEFRIKFQPVVS